jgi:hypothetical protein
MSLKHVSVGLIALLAVLAGCGSSSSTTPASGVKNRALISNSFGGASLPFGNVEIVNASNDTLSPQVISAGSAPGLMAVSPGREITLVFDVSANQVTAITNLTEKTGTAIQLPGFTESMVAKDANTGFAAIRNAATSQAELGAVVVLDIANTTISVTISVPRAHRIVMNHAGTKLLVFSDQYSPAACNGTSALTVIDIASNAPTTICGFDQAVMGVFSTDDNTAYIMNCGPECGGKNAGVAVMSMGSSSVTSTVNFAAAGATVGLLNGSNLFVAGTVGGASGAGTLTVVNVGAGTPTTGAPVHISDGFHAHMALGANNKLFVGSTDCTNTPNSSTPTGCLTIFDTSANTAVIDQAKGSVTGMAPIANRNVVYVIEGGELRIYDTTTNQESTKASIDIVGQAIDVKAIDQAQ